MCGICGNYSFAAGRPVDIATVKCMTRALRHRGPDGFGVFYGDGIALGHARLSIIDLGGGSQPIHNEDRTIWIVYNGEIYNYVELRQDLERRGHHFYTHTDTEVIIHLYEEKGADCVTAFNGQFAFALWDGRTQQVVLARDRVGVRPLYYTEQDGSLLFASEIKSLMADPRVKPAFDRAGLDQLFTLWATVPPRTVFTGISELPPAHYLVAGRTGVHVKRYWDMHDTPPDPALTEQDFEGRLAELLMDAIRVRLRADVPVAAYLSGGLDSSLISALVKKHFNSGLQTFSVAFADKSCDESSFQHVMASFLGTDHREISCAGGDIGMVMPDVVWHAEQPLVRSAPAPLFLLSRLVHDNGIKVVLTGEGADEILGGYDLFKEMKIRRFWARRPDSHARALLLGTLYGSQGNWPRQAPDFLEAFYRGYITRTDDPCFSHHPRWAATRGITAYYAPETKDALRANDTVAAFAATLPRGFDRWDPLAAAQYIEIRTLLSGNLLSSQGDRMAMAHSVEGRYPFLDHRLIEFCFTLPARLKLNVLREKYLLKKVAAPSLPPDIIRRGKQAYRAPDSASFFSTTPLPYVQDMLASDAVRASGIFDAVAVDALTAKCRRDGAVLTGNRQNMALTAILTTQLVDDMFVRGRRGLYTDSDAIPVYTQADREIA